jgi:hypothetical protein
MIKIVLSALLAMSLLQAEEMNPSKGSCSLSQEGALSVNWKAYKTASKIGVGGAFDNVSYTAAAPSGKNFREIFVGSTVLIDEKSVNSKNEGRDQKLVAFFFEQMVGESISAKIVDINSNKPMKGEPKTGTFITEVTMNGVTKTVPLAYSYDMGVLTAKGVIDLFDFSASKALMSINKACYDLHAGKTWNDVEIGFTTTVKALCHTK